MSDSERITKLERRIEQLSAGMEALRSQARFPAIRNPRLAITARDPDTDEYPDDCEAQDTYWIKFVDATFDEDDGTNDVTKVNRQQNAKQVARVIGGAGMVNGTPWKIFLPEGTLVAVFREHNRWWILHAWQPVVIKFANLSSTSYLSSGGNVAATFASGSEAGESVTVYDGLLEPGKRLPLGSYVVIALIDCKWWVIAVGVCPEDA